MADVQVKQIRSSNGASAVQRHTLRSLKLGRIGREPSTPIPRSCATPARSVDHLVEVSDG